jgi:GT2 family glycosyltransferase
MAAAPTLSVVVPVLDERPHLPALLASLRAQTRVPDEVLVVDGGSTDGTREWLAAEATRYRSWLVVVDNPQQWVGAAMNLGIAQARGDLVARMDAHARYAPDYLSRLVEALLARPEAAGAGGVYTMTGTSPTGRAIAAVTSSPIALGGAAHRTAREGRWVEHVGTGMYRRPVLEAVHGFDPSFRANEDFELDHRIGLVGGRIWLEPSARFESVARSSLGALARQMGRYGFYKARTVVTHPRSLRVRQVAPPLLILGLTAATALRPRAGAAALAAYVAAAAAAGVAVTRRAGARPTVVTPAVLPVVHLSWGGGFYAGLVRHGLDRLGVWPATDPGGSRPGEP